MSTLNVANVTDGTTSVPTGYVVNGSAKAYVRANDDAVTQEGQSLNVSSGTDHGTGDYSYSLSNALDARGAQLSNPRRNSNPHMTCMNESRDSASVMAVRHYNTSGLTGGRHIVTLFGDLA